MIRLAITLAAIALAVAVGAFFFPAKVIEEWSWRASIGSSLTTAIALMLGAIALLITAKVESSDYKAEQQIKSDIAEILSVLSMILHKGALARTIKIKTVDFSEQIKRIEIFANSTTGFAIYNLVASKSKLSPGKNEEWRLFFFYIAEIVSEPTQIGLVINRAVRIQGLLLKLRHNDLRVISNSVNNLVDGIRNFEAALQENVLVKAMRDAANEEQGGEDNALRSDKLMRKLLFLKSQGIDDPNIDLFIAAQEGDTAKLQAAMDRGADINMGDLALLRKYAVDLKQYKD